MSKEKFAASETNSTNLAEEVVCAPRVGCHTPLSACLLGKDLGLSTQSVKIIGEGNLVMFLMNKLHQKSATLRSGERFYDWLYQFRDESSRINLLAQRGFIEEARAKDWSLIGCHPSTAYWVHRCCPELLAGVQITTVSLHENAEYPNDVKYSVWYPKAYEQLLEQGVRPENVCLTSQLLPLELARNIENLYDQRLEKAGNVGKGEPLRMLVWPNGGGVLWKEDVLPFLAGLQNKSLIGNTTNPVEVEIMMGVNEKQAERYRNWLETPGVSVLSANNYLDVYNLTTQSLMGADLVIARPHLGAQIAQEAGIPLDIYGQPSAQKLGLRGGIERETAALLCERGVQFITLPEVVGMYFEDGVSGAWERLCRNLRNIERPSKSHALKSINETRDFYGMQTLD